MNKTSVANESFCLPNSPEYYQNCLDYLKGIEGSTAFMEPGQKHSGYLLPNTSEIKFSKQLTEKSLPRRICNYFYHPFGADTIKAIDVQDSATWVAEDGAIPVYDAIDDFTDLSIGRNKLAGILRMSLEFIGCMPEYRFEEYLIQRLSDNFGKTEEKAFISGTGSNEPTGILDTTGGAEVGETASALSMDSIENLYFSLDKDYRDNAVWIMNDKTALALRKLKDDNGMYLWGGETLLHHPVIISNYMPDADDGETPVAFGDFSYYWMVEREHFTIRTLREKFFEKGQIGYLAYEFMDGKLIRPDAVKLLKIEEA